MKKNNLLIILCIFSIILNAQPFNFQWAKSMGSSSDEQGMAVTVDAAGNAYSVGTFKGTVDFDPGSGVANLTAISAIYDTYIQKLDANGNFLWVKQISGVGTYSTYTEIIPTSIICDVAGNIYFSGLHSYSVDFNPGSASYTLSSHGSDDIFIEKLDPTGNFIWAKSFGSANYDYVSSLALDASNNIYVTGDFAGLTDFDPGIGTYTLNTSGGSSDIDIFIEKLDNNGNFLWAKKTGGTQSEQGKSLAIDAQGNIYSTGYFNGTTDFDPGLSINEYFGLTATNGSQDIYVQKLDANGIFIWAKKIGDFYNTINWGSGISVDNSGNVYVTGTFNGNIDFDPGTATYYNVLSDGAFILKLNTLGDFVWAKAIGDPYSNGNVEGVSISLDAANNVFISGNFTTTYTNSPIDLDPSSTGTVSILSNGLDDLYLVKLNSNGNYIDGFGIGGTGSDNVSDIYISNNAEIYLTGLYHRIVDFDPSANTSSLTSNAYSADIFVVKYSTCSATALGQPSSISGAQTICSSVIQTYSVIADVNATSYVWNLPAGATGSSTSNTIAISFSSPGTITVQSLNSCNVSPIQTQSIIVNPSPTVAVSGPTILCIGATTTLTASGANSYLWNAATTSNSIVVSPTNNTTYTVVGTGLNNCVNTSIYSQSVALCTFNKDNIVNSDEVIIFPNPNNGSFYISIPNLITEIIILNMQGQIIEHITSHEMKTLITIQKSGLYLIQYTQNNKVYSKKLLVNN